MGAGTRALSILLCSAVALGIAGCTSTQERFERAGKRETQGRHAEAARDYIRVLQDEPDFYGARERLRTSGNLAVTGWLEEAEQARLAGDSRAALALLDKVDSLRDDASGVGISLAVPSGYDGYRQDLATRVIGALRQEGEAAAADEKWSAALAAYKQAIRYVSDPDLKLEFDQLRAAAHLGWAEQEVEAGRFRAGFERAQSVEGLVGSEHPLSVQAEALRQTALTRGLWVVAFVPFWHTDEVGDEAPEEILKDLNDVLQYEHWSSDRPFISPADPVQLRRALRRNDLNRTVITRRQAARIGRTAEAELVVVGEWTLFERQEGEVEESVRKARLKKRAVTAGGIRDTSFVRQRYRLGFKARVDYRIIDTASGRKIAESHVDAHVSDRISRAVFNGDYHDLSLSGSQLSLFEDEGEAIDDLLDRLLDTLAPRLAEEVYDRILQEIP